MKRLIIIFVVSVCLAFAFGCASTYYVVHTKDGKELITREEPEFNKKSQSYEFTDVKGNKWILNREDIKDVERKEKGS
ncbi:MAG TPA: YgdI/YgdR family lipoprotein [Syntrophales bacterium]|nr:YgdI/YgdR family lipoprotein [Syntrophales bacterium]